MLDALGMSDDITRERLWAPPGYNGDLDRPSVGETLAELEHELFLLRAGDDSLVPPWLTRDQAEEQLEKDIEQLREQLEQRK